METLTKNKAKLGLKVSSKKGYWVEGTIIKLFDTKCAVNAKMSFGEQIYEALYSDLFIISETRHPLQKDEIKLGLTVYSKNNSFLFAEIVDVSSEFDSCDCTIKIKFSAEEEGIDCVYDYRNLLID